MTLQKSEDWHKQMAAQSGFVTPESVAELLKDSARLTFLESHPEIMPVTFNGITKLQAANGTVGIGTSLRAAIDKALSSLHPNAETSQEGNKK